MKSARKNSGRLRLPLQTIVGADEIRPKISGRLRLPLQIVVGADEIRRKDAVSSHKIRAGFACPYKSVQGR